MSFDKLLAELDELQLAKSAPADGGKMDDDKIAAAAEDGEGDDDAGMDDGMGDGDGDEMGDGESDGDGDETFGKSMTAIIDGEEQEVIDATEMLKSLSAQLGDLSGRFGSTEDMMLKAVTGLTDLVKSQAAEISSLSSKVAALSAAGRGRRSTVSVIDKPATEDLAKSATAADEPKGLGREEFMAKAMEAFESGKITGLQVSTAETCLNKGMPVPQAIITRVLA